MLANKGIQRLRGFERFTQLNDLYLVCAYVLPEQSDTPFSPVSGQEYNELTKIRHLDRLKRLTTLSLHDNRCVYVSVCMWVGGWVVWLGGCLVLYDCCCATL